MDTRLLRSFLAVVRTGSITAAAAELTYAQSTVTTHVKALERLMGTTLLDRHPAGATPTSAGEQIVVIAQQIVDLEEHMYVEAGVADKRAAGPVRLHAPESICAYRLPRVLRTLADRFPGVRLSLSPATTRPALNAILDRTVDLALAVEPAMTDSGVDLVDLGEVPLSLVASPDTRLPATRTVTRAEIAEAGVLLLEHGCSYSDELSTLVTAGSHIATAPRFASIETVKRCVEVNLGVALLPTATVEEELGQGRLVQLEAPRFAAQNLWLARNPSRWLSPAVGVVHNLLVAELQT